jgi:hypothetical protein
MKAALFAALAVVVIAVGAAAVLRSTDNSTQTRYAVDSSVRLDNQPQR